MYGLDGREMKGKRKKNKEWNGKEKDLEGPQCLRT